MDITEALTTVGILGGLGVIIYSKVKDQSLRETWDELRELFRSEEAIQSGF